MKTLILTATLPLFACAALARETPPVKEAPAETVKRAHPAAWLGIAMGDSDGKVAVGQVVPGSPAAKAGLQSGDLLLKIGDTAVEGQIQRVLDTVGKQKPGDAIELRLQRGDKELAIRIELAERPAQLDGDFRGEFRKEKKEAVPPPRGGIVDRHGNRVERGKLGKTLEETKRAIEDVKEKMKQDAGQLRLEYDKMKNLHLTPKEDKKGPAPDIELDPFKEADGEKLFRYYFDREGPRHKTGDKGGGNQEDWELRLGLELPLFKWAEQNRKAAGKQRKSGDDFNPLLRFKIPNPAQEAAIWKRIQESIAHSLKQSDIGPDMVEKVMKAVEEARRGDPEKKARRSKLEAEAAKLEKEMESLKERSDKLREELKKTAE